MIDREKPVEKMNIRSKPKVGTTRWLTETHHEGRTFITNEKWTGKEWVETDNQNYHGTATDIKHKIGSG